MLVVVACDGGKHGAPDAPDAANAGDTSDATTCTDTGVAGCACSPVASGASGSLAVDRPLLKLVTDPTRCVIYGLAADAVLVFDTREKTLAARIDMPGVATDLDIAGDGGIGVVGLKANLVAVLDLENRTIARTVPTAADPYRIEVTRSGTAFYVNLDQHTDVHRIDLATGADATVQRYVHYQSDLELADDDIRLYIGDSASSGGGLALYDVTPGVFGLMDHTLALYNPARRVVVGKSGHAYWGEHQFSDSTDLQFMSGGTHEAILVEDDDGRIAVGTTHVWDAELVRPIATHQTQITAAAFAAAGQELWTYAASQLQFASVSDVVAGAPLGLREVGPAPLMTYTIDQLVHDPQRDVLYGRVGAQNAVLVIDGVTLQPTREIRVGSEPTDLALDPDGTALYVGHADMTGLGRIDLATAQFDRFVRMPVPPYEIEAVAPHRVIFNDRMGDTPTLFDIVTRARYAASSQHYQASLAVTAAGDALFVGDSGVSGGHLYKYTIGPTSLTQVGKTTYNGGYGFLGPQRRLAITATGTTAFYADYAIDGANLSVVRYAAPGVRVVSPDGRVALSSARVYDVATGVDLGALPAQSNAPAIDATSQTAFLPANGAITRVDLTGYTP